MSSVTLMVAIMVHDNCNYNHYNITIVTAMVHASGNGICNYYDT